MSKTISQSSENQFTALNVETSASGKWWVMLAAGIGMFMYALDVYIANLALPILGESFHASFATLQWVVLSYLLMITTLVLGAGRLGDIWNKKWLYLAGLLLFTLGSALCGIAPNIGFLIGFRILQGLGALIVEVLAPAIITQAFSSSERGRAQGIIWGLFVLGIAMGPGLGGLLIALGGWRLVFLINLPIGLIACAIVLFGVPSYPPLEVKPSFDLAGMVLITLTLTAFALASTLMQNKLIDLKIELALLAIAAIGLVSFLWVETRSSEPLVDLSIFRDLHLSIGLLIGLMVFMVVVTVNFILPLYLNLVKDYPVWEAGLLLMVNPIAQTLIVPIAGILCDRWQPRIVSCIGMVLLICGCFAISTFNAELTLLGYIGRVIIFGLGMGIFVASNSSAILGAVSKERLGIASGLMALSRNIGLMLGLSLLVTLFSLLTNTNAELVSEMTVIDAPVEALVFGVQKTFGVATLVLLTGALLAIFLWWSEQKQLKAIANLNPDSAP